jgi:hypothetical protein
VRLIDVRNIEDEYDGTGASIGFRDVASPIHDPEMGVWPSMGGMGSKPKEWHGEPFPQE